MQSNGRTRNRNANSGEPRLPMQRWHWQPNEPARWFARFESFRALGPNRSILAVYRAEREKAGKGGTVKRVPSSWDRAAGEWRWRERAEAYDEHERQRHEAERRKVRDARRRELEAVEWNRANGLLALADRIELELAEMLRLGRTVRKATEYVERNSTKDEGVTGAAVVEEHVMREQDATKLLAELRRLNAEGLDLARRAVGLPTTMAPAEAEGDEDATPDGRATKFEIVVVDHSKRPGE